MSQSTPILPTASELAILDVLWRLGSATVREVRKALGDKRSPTYTGTAKLLQLMQEKGLVTRETSGLAHTWAAANPPAETRSRLLDDFLDRGFGGSAKAMILQALETGRTSAEELAEIRQMLMDFEQT